MEDTSMMGNDCRILTIGMKFRIGCETKAS